jgi:hypothetical protein
LRVRKGLPAEGLGLCASGKLAGAVQMGFHQNLVAAVEPLVRKISRILPKSNLI